MTWLHPWAIALGAVAAGLPIAVHLLTRPKPMRLPLSTIRFVREAVQQRRARHRLRDWIVLLLRTAAVILLALAIARPLIGDRATQAPPPTGGTLRVVLLDASQSMAAESRGIAAFERGRTVAAGALAYAPGLRANLVLAAAQPRGVFEVPSSNLAAQRDALANAGTRPERLDLAGALAAAGEMLAADGQPGVRRELVVISDFQRTNWVSTDFSSLPDDAIITLEAVGADRPPPNFGVLRVALAGRAEEGREAQLEVEVGNYSGADRRTSVEVRVGDAVFSLDGDCPTGTATTLTTALTLSGERWQTGQARLIGVEDALAVDDTRPFVLEVRATPTYALITRQDAATRPSSSYYLERALAPNAQREGADASQPRIVRIDPLKLDRDAVAAAELIVVDHPGKLSTESAELLASLLRRGRALLYVAAEAIDATNLRQLADAAGSSLQLPVEFAPPPTGQARQSLFVTDLRRQEAPFKAFGDSAVAAFSPVRIAGGLATRPVEGALVDDVLAGYSDRSACLVVTTCGAGALGVLNADLNTSNLPTSPAFVPMMGELVDRLLARRGAANGATCGEPAAVYLPAEAGPPAGLTIVGQQPNNTADISANGELVEEALGVFWRIPAVGPPGIYRVERDGTTQFALAAALPARDESDLRPLAANVLTGRLAGGRKVEYRGAGGGPEGPRDDLWAWLIAGCVACMLGELAALRGFRT